MKRIAALILAALLALLVTAGAFAEEADKDPAKTAVASSGSSDSKDEVKLTDSQKTLLGKINEARKENGLEPLKSTALVQNAAMTRAAEQVKRYSHTRPDGSSCYTVLYEKGVSKNAYAAENIARGQKSAAEVFNKWMDSKGHKENILGSKYTSVGIGTHTGSDGKQYWVLLFLGE